MAYRRHPARPRRAMRGDQRDRIDLKTVQGIGRDIGTGPDGRHYAVTTQQQAANLPVGARLRGLSNFVEQRP